MRLLERTLKWVFIAPRAVTADALGGQVEGFAETRLPVRASVIPSTGGVVSRESGADRTWTMCLLMPADAKIALGDGVCVDGDTPQWRCVDVQRWSAHCAVKVERIFAARGVGE